MHIIKIIIVFLICMLPSCVSVDGQVTQEPTFEMQKEPTPKVSVFISLKKPEGPKVSIQISNIEIFDGEKWHLIMEQPVWVESHQLESSQQLLSRALLPSGTYNEVRYKIFNAIHHTDNKNDILNMDDIESFSLNTPLSVNKYDSTSLFMYWDHNASTISKANAYKPVISISAQDIPLTSELAFVTCPDINTIYIIRTDNNKVCGSWGLSGGPAQLAVFKNNNEMYVLTPDDSSIKVVELSSGITKDSFLIPLAIEPFFMVVDPEGVYAYILDRASTIFKVELASGNLVNRLQLQESGEYAVYLKQQQRIAISSEKSQRVFLLDTKSLQLIDTITAASPPKGLLEYNNYLYVAESDSNSVMFYNFNTSNIQRTRAGLSPRRFLAHDNYIFVSNSASGSVSVLVPGQLANFKEIKLGGQPSSMASSKARNWLYVNDLQSGSVAIVDMTIHRLKNRIGLKARPAFIDVIQ